MRTSPEGPVRGRPFVLAAAVGGVWRIPGAGRTAQTARRAPAPWTGRPPAGSTPHGEGARFAEAAGNGATISSAEVRWSGSNARPAALCCALRRSGRENGKGTVVTDGDRSSSRCPAPRLPGVADTEAMEHAMQMVALYERAAAAHPPGGPASAGQMLEAANLAGWRRRLEAIRAKRAGGRGNPP